MKSVRLLNTEELADEISKMFEKERGLLIIASPFVDIRSDLIKKLSSSPANIQFFIKTPSADETEKVRAVMDKLPNAEFIKVRNLHAKAYVSNECSIVSSFNLQRNPEKNIELGILFDNAEHAEMHKKLIGEFEKLLGSGKSLLKPAKASKIASGLDKKWYPPYGIFNMKYLYRAIMEKNGKDWIKGDPSDAKYRRVCEKIIAQYRNHIKPDGYYRGSTTLLKRQTNITEEMYWYGINNIKV
jgi:hypothetical protein